MEITLTKKQQDLIKKIVGKEAETVVQKVVNDWFEHFINTKYQSKKTLADKVDELNKE